MTHPADTEDLNNSQLLQINRICNDFEAAWATEEPSIEARIADADLGLRTALLHYLIELDMECRVQRACQLSVKDYKLRFPKLSTTWLQSTHDASGKEQPPEPSVEIDDSDVKLTVDELLQRVRSSNVVASDMTETLGQLNLSAATADEVGTALVNAQFLTDFQLESIVRRPVEPLVLGEYVLLEQIGEGGMGAVYRAVHRRMKRVVAVKVLKSNVQHAEEMAKRFSREIQVAAKLSHANIAAAYDAGEDHGLKYLVCEYIDGQNLSEIVGEHGPLSLPDAIAVTTQMVEGLAYAHGEGVIHRDIKPSNLLLDDDGNAKLLDVGLARINAPDSDQEDTTDLTKTGLIMGTVDYMSPEQAQNTRLADERSDLYSVGCTLHYLLTGRPPYHGTTSIERLLAHRDLPIPDLLDLNECVPDQIQDILEGCMAKSAENRYQTATELLEALHALQKTGIPEITLPFVDAVSFQKSQTEAWTALSKDTRKWTVGANAEGSPAGPDQLADTVRQPVTIDSPVNDSIATEVRKLPTSRWALMLASVLVLAVLVLWAFGFLTSGPTERPSVRNLNELDREQARRYHNEWVAAVASPDLNGLPLQLSLLPPGQFETSGGELALAAPLFMSSTEVPIAAYRQFVAATKHQSDSGGGGYGFDGAANRWEYRPEYGWNNLGDIVLSEDMPTVSVNYNDATAFCVWASEQTGLTVRLPTESEWEYASRCGRPGDWCCGETAEELSDYAWYAANSQSRLFKVATRKPNFWGLSDMHGNECEWCLPNASERADSAPLRGGSYSSLPSECTHSWRHLQRKQQIVHGAFRVIVEVDP